MRIPFPVNYGVFKKTVNMVSNMLRMSYVIWYADLQPDNTYRSCEIVYMRIYLGITPVKGGKRKYRGRGSRRTKKEGI